MSRRRIRSHSRSIVRRNPSLDLVDLGSWVVIGVGNFIVTSLAIWYGFGTNPSYGSGPPGIGGIGTYMGWINQFPVSFVVAGVGTIFLTIWAHDAIMGKK